jgi:hypothetical protein
MTLSRIVMHLARNPDAGVIGGDIEHGYALVAPLTEEGKLDDEAWGEHKADCSVRAFAPGEPLRDGRLARRGHNWFFDYDRRETEDDEPVFKLERHVFKVGEYVTVTDHNHAPLVYRIDSIEPAH